MYFIIIDNSVHVKTTFAQFHSTWILTKFIKEGKRERGTRKEIKEKGKMRERDKETRLFPNLTSIVNVNVWEKQKFPSKDGWGWRGTMIFFY